MASREEILAYVKERYGILPDYPWKRTPNYAILRHPHNRKWFAAVIDITEDKLGLNGDRLLDALNVKCDPLLVGPLRNEPGIFPAYHMNKAHWLTVVLAGPLPMGRICGLIDMSYGLTE